MEPPINILLIKAFVPIRKQSIDIPIGILSLSAYLKHKFNQSVHVQILDLRIEKNRQTKLIQVLQSFKPNLIGISLLTFEHPFLRSYLPLIRHHALNATIILGGPYPSSHYMDILPMFPDISCIVLGEGEQTLYQIVKASFDNQSIHSVHGIAYYANHTVHITPKQNYIHPLDTLPFPDYEAIPIHRYWGNHDQMNVILAEKKYAPVMSSRACPFQCIYCHRLFGKQFRKRSPNHFLNELDMLYHRYGVREFHIIDDVFNLDRSRMHDILHGIIDRNLSIRLAFPNALRADILDFTDIDLLKRAGAYMLTFAIETASKPMQKIIHKHLNLEKVWQNIIYANQIGLITKGYFMIGFPEESIEDIQLTIRWAIASQLDMAAFFFVVPFKGTVLYEQAIEKIDSQQFISFMDKQSYYELLTGHSLKWIHKMAYIKFYSLKRILRLIKKLPNKSYSLQRIFLAGTKVLSV